MKKRLLLFGGFLCSIGFYSCQKSIKEAPPAASDEPATFKNHKEKHPPSSLTDGLFSEISYTHDADVPGGPNTFTEGPSVDKHGNVFFSDQNHDKIYRWDAGTGNVTLWQQNSGGRSNGMEFDDDGNLIACADMHGQIWKIRPNGSHEVLANNYKNHLLNGPNDVWINPTNEGMYITDPMFPRPWWVHDVVNNTGDPRYLGNWDPTLNSGTGGLAWPPKYSDQGLGVAGHVYYQAPGSHHLVRVTSDSDPDWDAFHALPNGIVGTPDGKKLYINKWMGYGAGGTTGGIYVFDINKDGTLSHMKPFVKNLFYCDGMSMDEWGNIYVSADGGIRIYDPKGTLLQVIAVPSAANPSAANNVFGGPDQKTLFITGGGNEMIYKQKMNVKGVEKFGPDDDDGHDNGHDNGHDHDHD